MRLSYWPLYYESSNMHFQTINKPEYKLAKNRLIKLCNKCMRFNLLQTKANLVKYKCVFRNLVVDLIVSFLDHSSFVAFHAN